MTENTYACASADAYIYLNSILYRQDKNNVNMKWVADLAKYWYSTQRMAQIAKMYPVAGIIQTQIAATTLAIEKPETYKIQPLKESGPNQLFWCLYIAKYGYKQYLEAVHYGATNIEMREKSAISEFITNHPKRLKTTNYKLSVSGSQELAGKFMVQLRDSLDMCIAYSVFYGTTIYLVYPNRFLVFCPNIDEVADEKITIIYVEAAARGHYHYSLFDNTEEAKRNFVKKLRETHYEIVHYEKGLKGMSNYKVAELEAIADKLGVEYGEKIAKQELYNQLLVASSPATGRQN